MMRSFARTLLSAACLVSLAAAPLALADDEEASASDKKASKEEAKQPNGNVAKEMAALGEAAATLSKVKDEASAKEAAEQICKKFIRMQPIVRASEGELEMLAKAQNRVNDQMERLMTTEYFVPSGLQEAWTLMTDHFSRRSAQKRRRK